MEEDFGELNGTTEWSPAGGQPSGADGQARAAATPSAGRDRNVPRERRATLVSPIPAQLARSMMNDLRTPGAPAPTPMPPEVTRAVTDQPGALATEETNDHYSVELVDDEAALPPLERIQTLVDRARTLMEGGNLGGAVIAADQTLAEAAKITQSDAIDLVKAARPLFDRIFAAYVGLLAQTPVRLRSDEDLIGQELGDRTKYLLAHVDGKQTLEELSTSTGIPPVEAMKIAASLLAAGIVRV